MGLFDFITDLFGKREPLKSNTRNLQEKVDEAYKLIGFVENQMLDKQQMECIVKDSHSHLVIAGAGSGKTTTILGKVKYLLSTEQVLPQEFLILSFTNAAATEMRNRLLKETNQQIYVATFHKLGYDIIRRAEHITPKISQKDVRSFVFEQLMERSGENGYQQKIIRYLLFHQIQERSEFDFQSESEYREYLETNPPTTFLGERVKSYGEMEIANFLTQHGIHYLYEEPYPVDTRTEEYGHYYPDFYLPEYNVYIEYFGIDRNGKVPDYFSGKSTQSAAEIYQDGIHWKRWFHRQNGTRMIECYAYEHMDGNLLKNLETNLIKTGVKLNVLSFQDLVSETGRKN